jgi:hypothetical protein
VLVAEAGSTPSCSYELDPDLGLTKVDQGWIEFALENDAPELLPPGPIGRSVLDSISDSTTKLLYRELFDHAARVARPISFAIRCDSPAMRRQLLLTITATASGFRVDSSLRWARPNPAGELLRHGLPRDPARVLRICSWCKKMEADGEWCELDEAARRLGLFERGELPLLTHGMCPACHASINAMLDATS